MHAVRERTSTRARDKVVTHLVATILERGRNRLADIGVVARVNRVAAVIARRIIRACERALHAVLTTSGNERRHACHVVDVLAAATHHAVVLVRDGARANATRICHDDGWHRVVNDSL